MVGGCGCHDFGGCGCVGWWFFFFLSWTMVEVVVGGGGCGWLKTFCSGYFFILF